MGECERETRNETGTERTQKGDQSSGRACTKGGESERRREMKEGRERERESEFDQLHPE